MNRIRFVFLVALSIYLSACNEDPEPDASSLVGIWESREYMAAQDVDWVKTYRFEENGSFQQSQTVREPNSEADLGYIFYRNGSFDIHGQVLQLTDVEVFVSISDPSESMMSPREELVPVEMPKSQSMEFNLQNNNTVLLLKAECLVLDCEDQVFTRVN